MEKEHFLSLIEKYLDNRATPDEKTLVETYYVRMGEKKYSALSPEEEEIFKVKLLHKIETELWADQRLEPEEKNSSGFILPLRWVAAAAVLIIIGISLFLFKQSKISGTEKIDYASRILPGGDQAVLILGDGSRIDLGKADKGLIAGLSGQEIKKTDEGTIVYDQLAGNLPPESLKPSFNKLSTRNAQKFHVVLSDGTQVWLNSASSIRYPSIFSKDSRIVELEGEGYFEVAHDSSSPFIVKTGKQNVKVLGTHFNISAYEDDGTTRTTLLEGSVTVSTIASSGGVNRHIAHLLPGQQSELKGSELQVNNVDAQAAIDWKNGKFIFRNENIKSIMRKLSRWYDIEVEYQGNVENLSFGGKVSRSKNLKEALRILTLTGDVNIKVEGRRVTIMP
ncbi:FecR domain-containing protein [Pedobacter sp. ISL-68]|uniref:FecR family protein n=1 Tax=unclassified Pedobacter TaxID=2628915 RepID=UPI001BE8CE20|nr:MULTISPECIES: FecR family protein [unclassified Pedobacter]MBT2563122.1 FecR domain-containing protein [Pedobacter sp. ISL-64]MBT2593460.1 FecR domain-containing protein [Pedobacter sp. ISL-68]